MIFDLLAGQNLQLLSEVPRLCHTLEKARRSTHRLEAYRAGMVDVTLPGFRSLSERAELLGGFRARWESLRWTGVTRLSARALWMHHFAGDLLVYTQESGASVLQYLRLPIGGTPTSSWEDHQLGLEHGIKTFLANPEKNLLAVLEEWFDNGMPCVRLHIRRLDPARDILVSRGDQLTVCQPFATDIDIDVPIQFDEFSCEIEQVGPYISILFACYPSQDPGYCANFLMWDVVTQEQVANVTSLEYRSFAFLDYRWVLFGAISGDPNQGAERPPHPYLEIIDPTNPSCAIKLELNNDVGKHTSTYSTVDISIRSGATHEQISPTENWGIPFVSDPCRGVISAYVYCYNRDGGENRLPWYETHVFILDIENILSKASPLSRPGQHYIGWKDMASSTAIFSDTSVGNDLYRVFSRHAYVAGFRYVSPVQPLSPDDTTGPRCFFVYDFNPYREAPGHSPRATVGNPDPETGYSKGASEITSEVIGGLSCWKMRFDLPTAAGDVEKCHVALTDCGVVLFESSISGQEIITVFSIW